MKYILVYDILTSAVKTSLFTAEGVLVSAVSRPLEMIFRGLHAQQNPLDWWNGVVFTTGKILSDSGINPSQIAAVSFTDQVQVCLCVDRAGTPLYPAITWSDKRSLEIANPLGTMDCVEYRKITGQPDSPCTSIRKLIWVREKLPEIYKLTYKMIGCKDFVVLKLTDNFATDYSDAGSTGAFDINSLDWSDKILSLAGVEREKLPDAFPSTKIVGHVSKRAAAETGLAAGTPVVNGAGDFTCSAVGAGAICSGDTYLNLGSSSWVAAVSDVPLTDTEMNIVNCVHVNGKYLPLANAQEAGAAFKWLKNGIFSDSDGEVDAFKNVYPYDGVEELARQSPAGARGIIYVPYILSGKGAFVGLDVSHRRRDIMRAALEGVTMDLNLALSFYRNYFDIKKVAATGIASRERLWLEILSGVFDAEIAPAEIDNATVDSIGAAIIAGVAVGIYENFDQTRLFYKMKPSITPDEKESEIYKKIFERFRKLTQIY